jgi:GT2 family glycosyltransferase
MNEKETAKLSIKYDPFYMRPIDIIIPFHDAFNDLIKCFNSVTTVNSNRFLITLVDDASSDPKFKDQFDKINGVQVIQHEKQLGFGAAVNTGLKNTQQPYVLILHSDTILQANSVINLGNSLLNLSKENVMMVTAKADNPLVGDERCRGTRPITKDDEITTEDVIVDGFIPFYCCLSYRKLFQKIGLLEEYPYGYYEDEEFANRMNKAKFKQAICGNSWVTHKGGQSFKKFKDNENVSKIIEEDNFQRAYKKIKT